MSVVEKTIRKLQESQQRAGEGAGNTPQPNPQHGPAELISDSVATECARGVSITVERGTLRSAGLMPAEADASLLTRQYRKIKRPLITAAIGREGPRLPRGHLIMIASATAGEGKTFTAVNLAFSMSREKDVRVLLVDADVAKPQLSKLLGLGEARGLLDALRQPELDVESLIHPTDLPTLSVLSAGTSGDDATELLSSASMDRLAQDLGRNDPRRIVVLDSPPLLQTTESSALAHVAGQIVVVVRAESTPQPVLVDALKILDGHPALSLILNQSMRSVTSEYYYYGYGAESAESVAPR